MGEMEERSYVKNWANCEISQLHSMNVREGVLSATGLNTEFHTPSEAGWLRARNQFGAGLLRLNYHAFVAIHPPIAVTFSTPTPGYVNQSRSIQSRV